MRIIALLIIAMFVAATAWAEDEDQQPLCPVMSDILAKKVAAFIKGNGECETICSGCRCKGGPGFRTAKRKCVAWAEVISKCGAAPHKGCRRECTPVVPACADHAFGRAWLKAFAAGLGLKVEFVPPDPPAEAANVRQSSPGARTADVIK